MNDTVINFKTNSALKRRAQRNVERLGISLTTYLNAMLRKLDRIRSIDFEEDIELEPTPYLEKILKESEKERAEGYVSPPFKNAKEAIAWLDDPNAKYENGRSAREDD